MKKVKLKSNSQIIFLHKNNRYSVKKINRKKKKGFTLLEVITVIAIISLMAYVMLPKLTNYINESKKLKVVEQSRKVIMAVESYNIKANNKIDMNNTLGNAKSNAGVTKYFENITEETDKLLESMKIQDCYDIVKGSDFSIDTNSGIYKNIEKASNP